MEGGEGREGGEGVEVGEGGVEEQLIGNQLPMQSVCTYNHTHMQTLISPYPPLAVLHSL